MTGKIIALIDYVLGDQAILSALSSTVDLMFLVTGTVALVCKVLLDRVRFTEFMEELKVKLI